MGYLDNSSITVDAILTKKGREVLARGRNEFNITQFALSDDEVDYDLWNTDHPLGTAYYGAAIEAMPITEALPDETQMMKYKLVTLPKGTPQIPVVSVGQNTYSLNAGQQVVITPQTEALPDETQMMKYKLVTLQKGASRIPVVTVTPNTITLKPFGFTTIVPNTANFAQGNQRYGYTAILSDSSVAQITAKRSAVGQQFATVPQFIGDSQAGNSVAVSGLTFQITGFEHLMNQLNL